MMRKCFVTYLSSENYLDGVLCLKQSLDDVESKYDLLCLVTNDIIDKVSPYLDLFNIKYETIDVISYLNCWAKDKYEYLLNTASKCGIYNLESIDMGVYIDCDTFVLKNCDELFDYPIGSISTSFDSNKPHAMSSLFSFVPNKEVYKCFKMLVENVSNTIDGSIVDFMFNDNVQNKEMQIPIMKYGFPINFHSSYKYNEDISILHFVSLSTKPWNMNSSELTKLKNKYPIIKEYEKCLEKVKHKKSQILTYKHLNILNDLRKKLLTN